jgi:hypothetical protein
MALDPAPTVLGIPGDPAADPAIDDDAVRLRRTAQRHWAARRDLERRLHDGAALRISALTLRMGLLRHRHPDGEQDCGEHDFRAAVEELQHELHLVLQDLRDIAGLLYPPLLDEAGLGPALREAAARCPTPVRIDAPDERFAVLGCLPDAATPVGAGAVEIVVRREAGDVVVLVSGVRNCQAVISDGVRLLGGTVAVPGPAAITVRIPCV